MLAQGPSQHGAVPERQPLTRRGRAPRHTAVLHLNSVPCQSHRQNRSETRPRHVLLRPRSTVALPCHKSPNYSVPAPELPPGPWPCRGHAKQSSSAVGAAKPEPGTVPSQRGPGLAAAVTLSCAPLSLPSRGSGAPAVRAVLAACGGLGQRRRHPRPPGQVLESDSGHVGLKIRGSGRGCDGRGLCATDVGPGRTPPPAAPGPPAGLTAPPGPGSEGRDRSEEEDRDREPRLRGCLFSGDRQGWGGRGTDPGAGRGTLPGQSPAPAARGTGRTRGQGPMGPEGARPRERRENGHSQHGRTGPD